MSGIDRATAQELLETWRDLHRHPELAFEETRTAGVVAERLRGLGLAVREGVGRTGVVADLGGSGTRPNLLLSAEMDALPLDEDPDRDLRSIRPGAMHACGHDGHTAILLAVAAELARGEALPGTVRFLFQPAEEIGAGAEAMIQDGALDGPSWDGALALHLRPFTTVGTIGICSGSATAREAEFELHVGGTGGHGGRPHVSTDALLAAVEIVAAFQTLIPREVPALDPAVLSVCSFHAGTAANVMPDAAHIAGTVRTASDDVHELLFRRMGEMAASIARAFRCDAGLERREITPAVRNDHRMADLARAAAGTVVGADAVLEPEPVMAANDIALIYDRVPGCYIFLGAAHDDGRPPAPNHSPGWEFDERALEIGASVLVEAVERFMRSAG